MGRVSTCQKNCNTIDLRRAQVNYKIQFRERFHAMTPSSEIWLLSFISSLITRWHTCAIELGHNLSPVAISANFCPSESPGGAGGNVIHCRSRYSVAIDAIIASGTARVVLNQCGIGMSDVRNFCPQAHNSAARREKIGPRAIPVIRVAESPGGADPRRVKVRLHGERQAARLARDMLQRDLLRRHSVYMVGSCRAWLLHIIHVSAVFGVGVL